MIDELYLHLRKLVADNFAIELVDRIEYHLDRAKVVLCKVDDRYCWTNFEGIGLEDALTRAINKLENPNKDYVDLDGYTWVASQSSCYSTNHIKRFLSN